MIKTLLKAQLLSLFSVFRKGAKRDSKKQPLWVVVIGIIAIIYVAAFLMVSLFLGCLTICPILVEANLTWLYFTLPFLITILTTVFLGIFASQSQLFNAKDNELLLSMPIAPRHILASRIIMMLIPDYLLEIVILAISGGIYAYLFDVTFPGLLIFILLGLTVPLLSMSVSCLIGWAIAAITSRIKNKQLFITLFSLLFLAAYFVGYFYIMNAFNAGKEPTINWDVLLSSIADKVSIFIPPFYWIGNAIASHNTIHLLLSLAITVLPFIAVVALLSVSFIRITTEKKGTTKTKYLGKPMKTSSYKKALFLRDAKRLFSSAAYLMNAGIGFLMVIILSVVFTVQNTDVRLVLDSQLPGLGNVLPLGVALLICLISSTGAISASSISIEGKHFWILRLLPIKTADILLSKVKLHLTFALPASFAASAILCVAARPTLIEIVPYFILPLVFNVFCALLGILANLRFPKLNWVNEAQPVKQSAAAAAGMFVPMAIMSIFAIPSLFLVLVCVHPAFVLLGLALIFGVACVFLYKLLLGWGIRRFESL